MTSPSFTIQFMAVRRIIAIFDCDIDDSDIFCSKLSRGESQSAVADIFADRTAAEQAESLLKIKGGDMHLLCDTVHDKIFLIPVNDTGQNPADKVGTAFPACRIRI